VSLSKVANRNPASASFLVHELDIRLVVRFVNGERLRFDDVPGLEMRFIGPVHRRSACLLFHVLLRDQRIQTAYIFFF